MALKCKSVLVFLLLLALTKLYAQNENQTFSFQHITTGMSENTVSKLFEDSYGFIWVGTPNGINRFDGTDFKIYESRTDGKTGLTGGFISAIVEKSDTLFVGTNQGLSIYDRNMDVFRPYPFKNEGKKVALKNMQSIEKHGDFLWLGTYANGLYRYNIRTGQLKQFLIDDKISLGSTNKNLIRGISKLSGEGLLVISNAALFIITETMKVVTEQQENIDIMSILKGDSNNFLLGTRNGSLMTLKVSDDATFNVERTPISPGFVILSLAQDATGAIWLGTENDGVFIHSKDTGKTIQLKASVARPDAIASNSIWALMNSSDGVMWMAPFKKGLSFYDAKFHKFEHIKHDPFVKNSLNNNLVNCFLEDVKGNLWVGTDGGGLNYWNRTSMDFESYSLKDKNFSSNVVLSLLQTTENELWIGTWADGLTIFNTENGTYETWNTENSFLSSNNVFDLMQDRKGRIWMANLFGNVHVYDPKTKMDTTILIIAENDNAEVNTSARLLEDKNGNIWVGSQTSGLFKLTEKENGWAQKQYHTELENSVISNDFINTIFEDEFGTLWVGTQGGLNEYLPDSDSFRFTTKQDGLKSDAIKAIAIDTAKHLWLGTGEGIIRFNPETHDKTTYDIADGLQSNEFNAAAVYTTKNGEFVFGGSNGFNIFKAQNVAKRQNKPKVILVGMKIFNQPILPNDESGVLSKTIGQLDSVTLKYYHSVVNFDFKALTFRHPEKVNYAYFLEGFESDWNYVGTTAQATYTNLSPGTYTLRIKSSNSDGVWNTNETQLVVTVVPPFWQQWWFRILVAVTALGAIYAIYYIRMKRVRYYQMELECKIDERTQELQKQKKKLAKAAKKLTEKNEEIQRFTYAVSHDLKSPLHSIQVMANLISKEVDVKNHPDTEEYLDFIGQSCAIMKNLIDDITEIARLGKIDNKNELLDTREIIKTASNMAFGRFQQSKGELIVSDDMPPIYGDRNRLIQVFENLIDNAIKYMGDQKKPVVRVTSKMNKDQMQFFVIDNGSGMDENAQQKLFTPFQRFHAKTEGTGLGLYMIKKIIESHKGTICATSEGLGKGTTFIITLPKAA